jgi:hypothetical protein
MELREELRRRFREFDIECGDVSVGKTDADKEGGNNGDLLLQHPC